MKKAIAEAAAKAGPTTRNKKFGPCGTAATSLPCFRSKSVRVLFFSLFAFFRFLLFFAFFVFAHVVVPPFNDDNNNSTVLASSHARLDGVSVRPPRGESEKTRFKDVFVHGDSVRGLPKSTREQHEGEREPRVFLSERCELSVRARCFRELATSESVSNAAV